MDWNCWLNFKTNTKSIVLMVFLFFFFITLSVVVATDISKREAQIVGIIEEQAVNLDSRKFYYDPIMVQAEAHSVYTDPKKKEGQDIIFRRPNSDYGKEAIALSSVHNTWAIPTPRGGKKRQFVLLKRAPNGISVGTPGNEKTPYFGSFIYVTNFIPNITDESVQTFDVGGVKSVIEWDVWETRPRMTSFNVGWDTCDYTLLFTCESLQDMIMTASEELDAEKEAQKRRRRSADALQNKTSNRIFPPPRLHGRLTPIKTEPGFDANEYNDLYLDLDIHIPEPPKIRKKKAHLHLAKKKTPGGNKRKKRFFFGGKAKVGADGQNKFDKGNNIFKALTGGLGNILGGGGGNGSGGGLLSGLVNTASGLLGGITQTAGGLLDAGLNIGASANIGIDLGLGGEGGGGIGGLFSGLVGAAGGLVGGLAETAGDLVGTAVSTAGGLVGAAADVFGGIAGGMGDLAGGIIGSITGAAADPLSLFSNLGIDGILGGLADLSLGGGLGTEGAGPLGLLSGLGGGLLGGGEGGGGPLGGLANILGGGVNAISGLLGVGGEGGEGGGPLGGLANLFGGGINAISGLLGGGGEGGDGGGPLGGLANILGGGVSAITGLLGGGAEGITGLLGGGVDAIGNLLGGGAGSIAGMLGLGGDGEGGGGPLGALTGMLSGGLGALTNLAGGLLGGEGGPLGGIMSMLGGEGGGPFGALAGLFGLDGEGGGALGVLQTLISVGLNVTTGVLSGDWMGTLTGLLGGDTFQSLQGALGDAMESVAGVFGPEGIASLCGMIGVDGLAQLAAQLGQEGLNQLGELMKGGLPLAALVGMFGGDNPLASLSAQIGVGAGGEGGAGASANAAVKIGRRKRRSLAGLGGEALNIGKMLGGRHGGGVLDSLSHGIVGGSGDIIIGPIASAIGSTMDKLVGGGLGDVDFSCITEAISGVSDGNLGPPMVLSILLSGGLGSGGSINSLLKGSLFDVVNDKMHHLAGGMAGHILDFFRLSGEGGVPGYIGGVISNILEGDSGGGPGGPVKMANTILGPIASALDPINAVAAAALSISNNLPVVAKGMGQRIIKQLPNVIESLGLGGLVQVMGIGPVIGGVHGLADQIIISGESLVCAVDLLGNGIIDGIASTLVSMGIPREFATLAATGTKLAWTSEFIKVKGIAVGVRLGADLIGSQVNAGTYRGSGAGPAGDSSMQNWQSMMNDDGVPSNSLIVYGYTFPGCGEEKDFFYPDAAYVRSLFKPEKGGDPIAGYHLAGVEPGVFDLFYPDDPKAIDELEGKYGVLTPEAYKQPHRDANHGIRGKFGKHGAFVPDSPAKAAVINLDNIKTLDLYWMPADLHTRFALRPKKNANDQPLIYGFLFSGIRESPHIFVAEGNILTGFFVPDDLDYPGIVDCPHGMFVPDHIAGHARFVLEDKTEYANVKEVRGAFFPDAMNLAGAVGGRLSKSRTEKGVYNFVMDRLAVEFVYVKGHPAMKGIWAAFLSKEEWHYAPPPIPPPDENTDEKDKKTTGANGKVLDYFGIRIQSHRAEAFLPKNFDIEGVLLVIHEDNSKKRMPLAGALNVGKINGAWNFRVLKKHPEEYTKVEGEVVCLFVPTGYPKDDALIGKIKMDGANEKGEITFDPKQTQTEYFYENGDEIWVPPKFADFVKSAKDDGARPEPGGAKAESIETPTPEEDGVPGVITQTQLPPDRLKNYYFGPWHDSTSVEFHDDSLKTLPHVYQYGYYYFDPESSGPLFIPEVGAVGKFVPDDGGKGHNGFFFPSKLEKESKSVFFVKGGGSIPSGTAGKFYTTLKDQVQSREYFRCTFTEPKSLEPMKDVELIPGWELADTLTPKKGDGDFENGLVTPTKQRPKYRLVSIGGGFKGIVIHCPSDLDNPNNPIFQRFLHYKANRDGDVNPWGNVIILDPIVREVLKDQHVLGRGTIQPVIDSAPTVSKKILEKFTLLNWAWPLAKEGSPGWKRGEHLKLGAMSNIASMMDFRMWLLTKYDCKYFKPDGSTVIQLLTPKSGDAFVDDLAPAAPKDDWLKKLMEAKTQVFVSSTEGLLAAFSQSFNIDIEQLHPFFINIGHVNLKHIGKGGKNLSEVLTTAKFDDWGDKFNCELIEVDEFTRAQATEEQPMNGVDLGIQLTENVGSSMNYPNLASKLIKKINERKNAPPGTAMNNMGSTDMTGEVKLKTKLVVKQKKEAKTDSEEAGGTGDVGTRKRRKRDTPTLKRKTAKNIPGWKTQFRSPLTDNKTMSDEGVIWYGLGNCEQTKPPPIELHESKDPNQVIQYFMRVLRIECMDKAKEQITDLFNEGYIQLSDSEEYFEISKSNTRIHESRLLPSEIRKLSIAFEFTAFSKIYHTLRSKGAPTKGYIEEPNCIITRSVSFLTELTLYYIMKARRIMPAHSVRLTRNLLKTLRTVMTKLHQDIIALHEECPEKCDLDKRLTNGDKFRVMSLIQFIIHGMGPYNKGEKLKPSFFTFVSNNRAQIQERVDEFARQYPMKKNMEKAKGKERRKKRFIYKQV